MQSKISQKNTFTKKMKTLKNKTESLNPFSINSSCNDKCNGESFPINFDIRILNFEIFLNFIRNNLNLFEPYYLLLVQKCFDFCIEFVMEFH